MYPWKFCNDRHATRRPNTAYRYSKIDPRSFELSHGAYAAADCNAHRIGEINLQQTKTIPSWRQRTLGDDLERSADAQRVAISWE
ncbi:hypothetical protein EB74_13770 [Mycobacterium sp. SWH-M5]|nr:hypothetical protein EB74_13770 [Mycobacterium sp. SWH-M5]